jgi:RNA polymerase sigma factor (TIGR02999 family)
MTFFRLCCAATGNSHSLINSEGSKDMPAQKDVTQLLVDWSGGNQEAMDQLLPLVYDELRRLANHYLAQERPDHTLQPTALVHEAYLRLVETRSRNFRSRAYFFGVASQLMRRVLVDHARKHRAAIRGGGLAKLSLDEAGDLPDGRELDLVALDDALNTLASIDPRQSRIVELRFFGGLSVEETAELLEVSPATIKRDWSWAKAWLYREIKNS